MRAPDRKVRPTARLRKGYSTRPPPTYQELVGNFKNGGQEWRPKGDPEAVQVHDFPTEEGKVSPYGVYDPVRNEAFVNVGTDHDTAAFAVNSIAAWWHTMGQPAYPDATELLITADGGGSNNPRTRLWRLQLQHLADDTGLTIRVCHFPPGTSKWNKIEHRLFSHITMRVAGKCSERVSRGKQARHPIYNQPGDFRGMKKAGPLNK